MTRLRPLFTCALLASAGVVPAAWATEFAAACSKAPQMQQAAARLEEQLGSQHRVCALGVLPSQACEGQITETAMELLGPIAQGRVVAAATLHCADGSRRRLPFWFSVQTTQLTPLARRPLAAGAWVVPADFDWTERLRPAPGDDWSNRDWAAGSMRLVRPLRTGDILLGSDLRTAAAVEPGIPVEARLSEGGVRLQLDAVAMSGGALGERVRVKSRLGGRSLPARVTGNHTVELLP